jgi:hypothetical protein
VKSHGGEDDSTGLRTEHSLDHTAHAVRTVSGVLAAPPQQKQSVMMGSRPVPHLVFFARRFQSQATATCEADLEIIRHTLRTTSIG